MEELLLSGKCLYRLWLVIPFSFLLCLLLLPFDYSSLIISSGHYFGDAFTSFQDFPSRNFNITPLIGNFTFGATTTKTNICITKAEQFVGNQVNNNNSVTLSICSDSCCGRYIYVHDVPSRFNDDLLTKCKSLNKWFDMCPYLENSCLGPQVKNPKGVLSNNSWFSTNQFMLDVIFRKRLKQYKCLTNDSAKASAIYVPFYAGLDVGRYLWDYNTSMRDSSAIDLARWLASKPEWKRIGGRDHFFVAGRIAWDFHRPTDNDVDWGSKLIYFPEFINMTMLSIESSCRTHQTNEFAIPYPTYFHPSSENEVVGWQKRIRNRKRNYLFSFAGAPRPNMKNSVRGEIISKCLASKRICKLLDCSPGIGNNCEDPVEVIKVLKDSVFCLQPPGDSYTRRSTFDSILAGCIPVFFHPGSAYAQYQWHFPKNHTKYSIYIPMNDVKSGKVKITETLLGVSKDEIWSMREEVIRLIPKIVYADPRSSLESSLEDAFSIAVKGVLERIDNVKKLIKEGKDPSIGSAHENNCDG